MAPTRFPEPLVLVLAERSPRALLRALRRAEKAARVAELRLDFLPSVAAIVDFLERLARKPSKLTLIATCRRRADGGEFEGSPSAQVAVLELAIRAGCPWVDVDAASLAAFPPSLRRVFLRKARRIVSFHDFRKTPRDLAGKIRQAKKLGADLVKVATFARRHTDAARLLRQVRRGRGRVVGVTMGDAGVAGRVLVLREGSPLTFAVENRRAAVAPGQLTLQELRETYRAPRLNRRTRVYGVLGNPATHSLSPAMQNAAFRHARVNAVYLPFETESLKDFLSCLRDYGVAGFSVTAPFKEQIVSRLDAVDPIAGMIGAVNTVLVGKRGKLSGFNTDYVGALRCLAKKISLECSAALILGAGGSARACAFALATAGAFVSVCARRPAKARALARAVGGEAVQRKGLARRRFDIVINCTPAGQSPRENESPLLLREINARVVLDMVYRPLETRFLRLARKRGARIVSGLEMLVEQGAAQFEIWTERRAPVAVMRRAARQALRAAAK